MPVKQDVTAVEFLKANKMNKAQHGQQDWRGARSKMAPGPCLSIDLGTSSAPARPQTVRAPWAALNWRLAHPKAYGCSSAGVISRPALGSSVIRAAMVKSWPIALANNYEPLQDDDRGPASLPHTESEGAFPLEIPGGTPFLNAVDSALRVTPQSALGSKRRWVHVDERGAARVVEVRPARARQQLQGCPCYAPPAPQPCRSTPGRASVPSCAAAVQIDKHQLVSDLGIRYRDLLALDPTVPIPSPSNLLIRCASTWRCSWRPLAFLGPATIFCCARLHGSAFLRRSAAAAATQCCACRHTLAYTATASCCPNAPPLLPKKGACNGGQPGSGAHDRLRQPGVRAVCAQR